MHFSSLPSGYFAASRTLLSKVCDRLVKLSNFPAPRWIGARRARGWLPSSFGLGVLFLGVLSLSVLGPAGFGLGILGLGVLTFSALGLVTLVLLLMMPTESCSGRCGLGFGALEDVQNKSVSSRQTLG